MTDEMKLEEEWATLEFADVELQDARLNRRCQELASALGQQPTVYINQACADWADTKAAYRFFGNTRKVTPARIRAPHQQRTVERMQSHQLVLAVQDATFFNYTHHPRTSGLGEIGTKTQQQRGFGLHSTLVVTPAGVPLGILTQRYFSRPIGEPAHALAELRRQPIEAKESYHWLEAFEQSLGLAPAGVELVTVCDRDADLYEMFILAEEKRAGLVIRAAADRSLIEKEVGKLRAKVRQQPLAGLLTLQISANSQRPARQTTVSVRFTAVTFKPPWRPNQKKLPPVTLTAIWVHEEQPPVDSDDPIEWLLLTNTSVQNFGAAERVVGWYSCRWQIELYHKLLKSCTTILP